MPLAESAAATGLFNGGDGATVAAGGSGANGGASGSGTTNNGGGAGTGNGSNNGAGGSVTATLSSDPYEVMQEVEKSNGGEFHRTAIVVGVPEALKDDFKLTFGAGSGAEEYGLMKDSATGFMILKAPGSGDKPFTPSFKPSETSPTESQSDHDKRMAEMEDVSFERGFVCGVGYGGADMVTSTGSLIAGAANFMGRGYAGIALGFKWASQWMMGEDSTETQEMIIELGEANEKVVNQTYQAAKFLNDLLGAPQTQMAQVAWGFYTGDQRLIATALYGSDSHRQLFQMACEAITETKKDWQNGTEGQIGYLTGRIVFEVASILIPAGTAGKVVSKLEILAHLKQTKLFKAGARAVMTAKQGALALTKMCFVAGTKVKVLGDERIKIEDMRADMEVWSRDEMTGQECLKRVVQAFTTHPTELYRLTYEVRGPPGSDGSVTFVAQTETLGVTAPHPFWVCNNELPGFIAAEDLRVGDVLYVGECHEAVVTSKVLERAPAGEVFTTYNFEVEDFHTYFVGQAGVWVHNASPAACKLVLDMFENLLPTLSNNLTTAWRTTSQAIAHLERASLLQLKLFTEVRPKWLANLANNVPPWLNTAVQNLPAGVVGDSRRLKRNIMKTLGFKAPKNMAAHHIVEKADNPQVREVIERAGLHIDEAANGVLLPGKPMVDEYAAAGWSDWLDGLGPTHNGSHSSAYSKAVRDRILPLDGQSADVIRNELQQIAKELVEGTFPWP